MASKISVTEFSRRLCEGVHTAKFASKTPSGQPNGNVPCPEHLRYGRIYYGLIDPLNAKLATALVREIEEAGK